MIVQRPSEFSRRLLSSSGAIAFLTLLFIGIPTALGPIFVALILFLLFRLAQKELQRLVSPKDIQIEQNITNLWIGLGLLYLLLSVDKSLSFEKMYVLLNLIIMTHVFASTWHSAKQSIVQALSGAILSFNYLAMPLLLIYFFLYKSNGSPEYMRWLLFYLILVIKGSDVGGYFIGKSLGRNSIAPVLSPKKTWEGLGGAIVFAGTLSALCSHLFYANLLPISAATNFQYLLPNNPYSAFLMGGLLAVVGQIGDLFESALKREARIKDSGTIPGLGGILDMLDSFLFGLPVGIFIVLS